MGHTAKYKAKGKQKIHAAEYADEVDSAKREKNKSDAWRKIEEIKMFKQFCHDLEFFDDHLEGSWDDYLQ